MRSLQRMCPIHSPPAFVRPLPVSEGRMVGFLSGRLRVWRKTDNYSRKWEEYGDGGTAIWGGSGTLPEGALVKQRPEGEGGMSCAKASCWRLFQGEGTAYGKFKNLRIGSVQLECGVQMVMPEGQAVDPGVHEEKEIRSRTQTLKTWTNQRNPMMINE